MEVLTNVAGLERVEVENKGDAYRVVAQSSSSRDGLPRGSVSLIVGEAVLSRSQVVKLVGHLESWLRTGSLKYDKTATTQIMPLVASLPYAGQVS